MIMPVSSKVLSVHPAFERYLAATHWASLDGLRGLAILPVIWHHATPRPLPGIAGKGAAFVRTSTPCDPELFVEEIRPYGLELLAMEQPSQDPATMEKAFQAAAEIGVPIVNCGPGGKIIRGIQKFLDGRDFIEVETPVLQPQYGGAAA